MLCQTWSNKYSKNKTLVDTRLSLRSLSYIFDLLSNFLLSYFLFSLLLKYCSHLLYERKVTSYNSQTFENFISWYIDDCTFSSIIDKISFDKGIKLQAWLCFFQYSIVYNKKKSRPTWAVRLTEKYTSVMISTFFLRRP